MTESFKIKKNILKLSIYVCSKDLLIENKNRWDQDKNHPKLSFSVKKL